MKVFLSLVCVVLMSGVAIAQPPREAGKFGMGPGKFGDPAKMAQMARSWHDQKPDVDKVPGPPPWAGKGIRMGGQRGPQPPFLGRGPENHGPKKGANLRGSGQKHKVPGYNPDCGWGRWQSGNPVGPHKGRGFKSGKLEGSNKSITITIEIN